MKIKALAENHPYVYQFLAASIPGKLDCTLTHTMPIGPAGTENHNVAEIDGSSPMMLKAIANTWILE